MPPNSIEIGGLALILALLAFAQRLGAWKNKHTARALVLVAAGLGIAWLALFLPTAFAWPCSLVLAGIIIWPVPRWFGEWIDRNQASEQPVARLSTVEAETVPAGAPSIRVEYRSGIVGTLILKNDKPSPATIRRVGKLISQERYASEYELNLIPRVLPPIEVGIPVECKVCGLNDDSARGSSLEEVLSGGTPQCVDSLVIDYDDCDGREFSRRFLLHRNIDGSIVWLPDPISLRGKTKSSDPEVQSLAELRPKLRLAASFQTEHKIAQESLEGLAKATERFQILRTAAEDLKLAGQLHLLADEADALLEQLRIILSENETVQPSLDLSHPLSREAIFIDTPEPIPLQRLPIIRFRDRYQRHWDRVTKRLAFHSKVMPPNIPSTLEASQWEIILINHGDSLREKARGVAEPHEKALRGDPL